MSTMEQAIVANGYDLPREGCVADGKIHRFPSSSSKRHSKDAWYVLHGEYGAFGSWRDNVSQGWFNGSGYKLTKADWEVIEKQKQEARKEAVLIANDAARRAQRAYDAASTEGESEYLTRKGVGIPAGVRFVKDLDSTALGFSKAWKIAGILIPAYDRDGKLRTLQVIPDGYKKLFIPESQTASCFHILGDITQAERIVIAEGIATAQSIVEATGLPVVVAFSSGNMERVARVIRLKAQQARITIAADDDDAGRISSNDAAKAIKGDIVTAPNGGDFNDLHMAQGLDAVRSAFIVDNKNWRSDLIVTNKSDGTQSVTKCIANFVHILSESPAWKGVFCFDEFYNRIIPRRKLPIKNFDGNEILPHHMSEVRIWLERNEFYQSLAKDVVNEAIITASMYEKENCIKEYLNSIKWDGINRVNTFLKNSVDCDDTDYTRAVSKSFFVSAIARIFSPGCQVDTVMVLEGIQGLRKSTLLKELVGREWCAAVTASFNDKDFYQNLRGKWVMVFDDLHGMKSADQNRMKQIITSDVDTYRASYAAISQDWKRQNIFAATTNEHQYLDDPTGSRRFLPIVCKKISIEYVKQNRDQLWAEALVCYKKGDDWWTIPNAGDEQEMRQEYDPWHSKIEAYVQDKEQMKLFSEKSASIFPEDVMENCLFIPTRDFTKAARNRVCTVLVRLGYTQYVGKNKDRKSFRCYRLRI